MAKNKKQKTGGKSRGTPRRGQPTTRTPPSKAFVRPSVNDDSDRAHFTLRDEVRNTGAQGSSGAFSSTNLRHKGIGFVRADDGLKGTLSDGNKDQSNERAPELAAEQVDARDVSLQAPQPTRRVVGLDGLFAEHVGPDRGLLAEKRVSAEAADGPHLLTARRPSLTPSDSSEEVVVFAGRHTTKQHAHSNASESRPDTTRGVCPPAPHLQSKDVTLMSKPPQRVTEAAFKDPLPHVSPPKSPIARARPNPDKQEKRRVKKRSSRKTSSAEDSDAVLADYMENIRTNGDLDDDWVTKAQGLGTDTDNDGWRTDDIGDFDNMSTSDEVMDAICEVLSKRERPSGLQYLVVWEGHTTDDARWIPHESLNMDGAVELIEAFEEQEKLIVEYVSGSDDDDDNDFEDDDDSSEDDEGEDYADEEDLIQRRIARMSDEKIARLLAKQEELGMGSEELLLFEDPGSDMDLDEEEEDEADFIGFASKTSKRAPAKRSKRGGRGSGRHPLDPFLGPADDILATEEYRDFDIMDFDRPSLTASGGKKKKDEPPSFGLSDSEIESSIRDAWAVDRKKKKAKKQEREVLRAQGLLGKKNKFKPDLSARYNEGLTFEQMGDELEEFLMNDHESCALPPMDKRERKIIHEISSKFNLKSKSVGSGKSRFPVLYKTSRTIPFDDVLFEKLQKQLNKRFFPRMDKKAGAKGFSGPPRRRGGGGTAGGFSYTDGETVGAAAPELGSDNRGRAMLEKMGWSKGMALGTLDNQGILQPITHVVKNTRAGLG